MLRSVSGCAERNARPGSGFDTMSQIFHRHSNIYSRLSILAVILFVASLGGIVAMLHLSGYNTRQSDYVEQPVQFSHAHHVGGIGIDCRYCHTTVESRRLRTFPLPRPA